MSTKNYKQERFHFLDSLRGFASLLIVIHHSLTSNIAKYFVSIKLPFVAFQLSNFTQSGVELFFVLSGVVLLRPYLRKERKFSTLDYFKRRFLRIYPSYFVALVFGALILLLLKNYPTWYSSEMFKWESVDYKNFIHQIFIINTTGFYYNLAWWSLQIEVIFYLLVPFIIFSFKYYRRDNLAKQAMIVLAVGAISIALQLCLSKYIPYIYNYRSPSYTYSKFIEYLVCFTLGTFLARNDYKIETSIYYFCFGIILLLLSYFINIQNNSNYYQLTNIAYGLIYFALIIFVFNSKNLQLKLNNPFLIWLGERSYSLFLVHFSLFYLIDYLVSNIIPDRNIWYGLTTRFLYFPVSIFVAMLLFHFVEKRFARGLTTGNAFWPWQAFQKN